MGQVLAAESLRRRFLDQHLTDKTTFRLVLDFSGHVTEVLTNSMALKDRLREYFGEFALGPEATPEPAVRMTALEVPAPEPGELRDMGLEFTLKERDPGKSSIKEEFANLPDGRVVRKRLTGMLFVFDRDEHLVIGPCLENDNQVVNFINNRFIQWTLDRGALLFHAAGVAMSRDGGYSGLALAGFAGMGKSTLALACMSKGATFVSNDRLMVGGGGQRTQDVRPGQDAAHQPWHRAAQRGSAVRDSPGGTGEVRAHAPERVVGRGAQIRRLYRQVLRTGALCPAGLHERPGVVELAQALRRGAFRGPGRKGEPR